jgi:thermolabile hemolysin
MRSVTSLHHRLLMGGALCFAATAAHATSPASLACYYTKLDDKTGVATGTLDAGPVLSGTWHHGKILSWGNLYRTTTPRAAVKAICDAGIKGLPGAGRVIGASATGAPWSGDFTYPIWHEGDLRPGEPIERIVSFGDSLTDTGNMLTASRQVFSAIFMGKTLPSSSWFAGRFSNGPSWVEYLAERNGLSLVNWAVGGAQTRNGKLGLIHGIGKQVDTYFEHIRDVKDYDPARTLFTFMVAGNDFVNDSKYATNIVSQQRKTLMDLVRHGARKVMVVNLPDVTRAPVFRMGRDDADKVRSQVDIYNSGLAGIVASVTREAVDTGIVRHKDELEIRIVDARARFDQVLADPRGFGFDNSTESCLEIDKESSFSYIQEQIPRKHCDASRFVFWDTLHPTTRMHELMSGWAAASAPRAWALK